MKIYHIFVKFFEILAIFGIPLSAIALKNP